MCRLLCVPCPGYLYIMTDLWRASLHKNLTQGTYNSCGPQRATSLSSEVNSGRMRSSMARPFYQIITVYSKSQCSLWLCFSNLCKHFQGFCAKTTMKPPTTPRICYFFVYSTGYTCFQESTSPCFSIAASAFPHHLCFSTSPN